MATVNKNRFSDWFVLYLEDASLDSDVTDGAAFEVDYDESSVAGTDYFLGAELNDVLDIVQQEMEELVESSAVEDTGPLAIVYEGTLGGTLTPVAVVRPEVSISVTFRAVKN
jgi:hypothetical protein